MSWGWKITILYVGFVIMTLAMVFYFMGQKVDLVTEEYYKEEIKYQDQIDRITNAKALNDPVKVEYSLHEKKVKISFPKSHTGQTIKGNIHFYSPSDSEEDRDFPVKVMDEGIQTIYVGSLRKGLWRIKIRWHAGDKEYYHEQLITL